MKIISILKNLIVEQFKIFPVIEKGNKKIILYQTKHQRFDRGGDDPITNELIQRINKGFYKSGVNSRIIRKSIEKHFDKIFEEFKNNLPNNINYKIIVVDGSEDYPANFIEYILGGNILDENVIRLDIITSAYSDDGGFLYNTKKTPMLIFENICISINKILRFS